MISNFLKRIFYSLKIETSLYEEIQNKNFTIFESITLAFLAGLSNALVYKKYFETLEISIVFPFLFLIIIWFFINWFLLSFIINFVCYKIFPEGIKKSKSKNVLRSIGYSYTPEFLKVLILFFPQIIQALSWSSFIWVIACQVVMVKTVFKFKSGWKSLGVLVLSYIFRILIVILFLIIIFNLSK